MNNNIKLEEDELISTYAQVDEVIEKSYLHHLDKYAVIPIPNKLKNLKDVAEYTRLFQVTKITFDENEDILDKLTTVYSTVHSLDGDMVIILHSDVNGVELYIGTKDHNSKGLTDISAGFKQSFNGNFPGCTLKRFKNSETSILLTSKIFKDNVNAVSVANGIPNLKNDDKEKFTQGLEKFIEAMQGKEYTALLIANAINSKDIAQRKGAFESIYSSLVPFSTQEVSFGSNESTAITKGVSKAFTYTANNSLAITESHTEGTNESAAKTSTHTGGAMAGIMIPPFIFGGNYSYSKGKTKTKGSSESDTTGTTQTEGISNSDTQGINSSDSKTKGTSETYQINYENKTVKNLLEKIDIQIKRIDESEDYGMYDYAAYFISSDTKTTKVAASAFRAIMRGDESSVEKSSVFSWSVETSKNEILPYLRQLKHPVINLANNIQITPTTLISSKELSMTMGLPRKSVKGVIVTQSVEFARNIHFLDDNVSDQKVLLGSMYHLGKNEKDSEVELDINSLGMHTLITGSTGSGKSNTIYTILDGLSKKGINFLVIEPAKGEYKEVFGGRDDVKVFGSNLKYTDLLKINPFAFCDEIHVLEHVDRLIEIFNACWPMYAAMPAVLKDAVIKSYVTCGWDIDTSICLGEEIKYPTFDVLLTVLEEVIATSQYSEEMKSNYKGALLTRIKSLTNGLLGQMLNQAEAVDETILFDSNVIVDISRIGSMETKSLIMGMLMLKLIEYRYAKKDGSNSELKHVTVLEEAHNLLKRTSTEQSGESSNLQGKAVEMLSNAIAEMRTYGEGFIIADQSPNMLDMSAIRNTGTKIIMRLPEFADRNDIGKSAALNDEQIDELPKLATGVAVVYQNNWLEAVLCKVDKFEGKNSFQYQNIIKEKMAERKKNIGKILQILLMNRVDNISKNEIDAIDYISLHEWIENQNYDSTLKRRLIPELIKYQEHKTPDLHNQDRFTELSELIFTLADGKKILSLTKSTQSFNEYDDRLTKIIRHYIDTQENEMFEVSIKQSLLSFEGHNTNNFKELYFSWVEKNRIVQGDMV